MPYLTLRMVIIQFSDVKGFEDSDVQQTDFQEQRLESVSRSTVYSHDLYFASFQAMLWERGIHLQTISILFEQFLAVLLGLM